MIQNLRPHRDGNKLTYKDIHFTQAAVDFPGSEKLDRLRKGFVVFLVIVAFVEGASITVQSATLSGIQVGVERPWLVNVGFWALMLYSFLVYRTELGKAVRVYNVLSFDRSSFFQQLNRAEFAKRFNNVVDRPSRIGDGQIIFTDDNDSTTMKYGFLHDVPAEKLAQIEGFSPADSTFIYQHTPEDETYYEENRALIRAAVSTNYLQYIMPTHAAYALVAFKLASEAWAYMR